MSRFNLSIYWGRASKVIFATIILFLFQNCGEGFKAGNEAVLELSSHAPVITVTQSPTLLTNQRDLLVKFDTTLNQLASVRKITCTLDATLPELCQNTFAKPSLIDGDHILRIAAEDNFGNKSDEAILLWRVDGTKPVATINTSPSAVTGQTTAALVFSAFDNLSGVVAIECSLDAAAFGPCTSPMNLTNLVEKNYVLKVRALDAAGNISADASAQWRVDLTAPSINILTGPANLSNSKTATFTFNGTDNGVLLTDFECELDGGGFAPCASPRTYNNIAEGSHSFSLKARDSAGNMSAAVNNAWSVDSLAPSLQLVSNPQNPTNQTSATFQFTPNDGTGSGINRTECSLDNGAFAKCNSPVVYANLTNGNHTFAARAVDNATNVSTPITFMWTIDNVPPQISIASSVSASTTSTSATMTITTADAGGSGVKTLECKLDAEVFAACTNPKNYSGLALGSHTFTARVTDNANNQSMSSFTWTVTMAAQLTAELTWDPNTDADLAGYKIMYGTVPGNLTIAVDVGNPALVNGAVKHTIASGLTAGQTYYFAIVAYDLSGNQSVFSNEVSKSF